MINGTEGKLLRKIAEMSLATKTELKDIMKKEGNGRSDTGSVVETATNNLIEKGLIATINPIGSSCFVITRKGSKLLHELK